MLGRPGTANKQLQAVARGDDRFLASGEKPCATGQWFHTHELSVDQPAVDTSSAGISVLAFQDPHLLISVSGLTFLWMVCAVPARKIGRAHV